MNNVIFDFQLVNLFEHLIIHGYQPLQHLILRMVGLQTLKTQLLEIFVVVQLYEQIDTLKFLL